MKFEVKYHEMVFREDIPKLPKTLKERIKKAIEQRLVLYPAKFGKPLRRSLKGYYKLRVGDYRVIFRIEKDAVKIFMIQHRSIVYENILQRILN